ncbi:Metallo-dependent phosphatase-like protein [Jimgerdemannia flammicorona]|uniref:Metallo-dependent phosphatase-like protein n=1 Tax=Jimgerdemannia flammicorona TaxID=994334 RepID=A0A433QD04_9FUNG|nr:Metallo-dependent phosphatase-like protein [Jimgerdemannia flammicorona]
MLGNPSSLLALLLGSLLFVDPAASAPRFALSPYANLTRIATLPAFLSRRLVVIGDVHGCLDELNLLLAEIQYNPSVDHLIFTGDLLAKGPKSIEVIRRVKELGASCVRGNHDDRVIRWRGYLNQMEREDGRRFGEYVDLTEVPEEFREPLMSEHRELARALSDIEYEFLVSCPLILRIPEFNTVVVHAGLDPSIPTTELEDQDPHDVMYMRNIYQGQPRTNKKKGQHWGKVWNEVQRRRRFPLNVWYGHDAGRGLMMLPFSVGADTGCVYGRELTAITIPDREMFSVKCATYAEK